jgi:SAM-dependent methyltransferase
MATVVSEVSRLEAHLSELVREREGLLRVLEAGCGDTSYVRLPGKAYVVGLDISEDQLRRNTSVDEKILGDIQTYDLPSESFDVIVCWWVLEHVTHPERALARFARALRPGGVIVLAVPNLLSIKGAITKLTPHWLHVWVYRVLYHDPRAGRPGYAPFRTYLRWAVSPPGLKRFASAQGLTVEYLRLYQALATQKLLRRHPVIGMPWRLLQGLVPLATFGRLDIGLTECIAVLRRPDVPAYAGGDAVAVNHLL